MQIYFADLTPTPPPPDPDPQLPSPDPDPAGEPEDNPDVIDPSVVPLPA